MSALRSKRRPKNTISSKGALDLLILKIVNHGPIHGYAIFAAHAANFTGFFSRFRKVSLYPALHRLEDRGWIEAEWKISETGREAKFYSLTKKGRKQLDAENCSLGAFFSGAVALILRATEIRICHELLPQNATPTTSSIPSFAFHLDQQIAAHIASGLAAGRKRAARAPPRIRRPSASPKNPSADMKWFGALENIFRDISLSACVNSAKIPASPRSPFSRSASASARTPPSLASFYGALLRPLPFLPPGANRSAHRI